MYLSVQNMRNVLTEVHLPQARVNQLHDKMILLSDKT